MLHHLPAGDLLEALGSCATAGPRCSAQAAHPARQPPRSLSSRCCWSMPTAARAHTCAMQACSDMCLCGKQATNYSFPRFNEIADPITSSPHNSRRSQDHRATAALKRRRFPEGPFSVTLYVAYTRECKHVRVHVSMCRSVALTWCRHGR